MRKLSMDKNELRLLYRDKKYSQDKIAEMLNCSQWVVSNRLRSFNIPTRPKTCNLVKRKYEYDKNFFKKITTDVAWALGLLVSDGFVKINQRYGYFGLKLKNEDKDVIFKVKRILRYDGPILKAKTMLKHKGTIKRFNFSLLKINDTNMANELEKLGIRQNKTHNENFLACIKETNNEGIISSFIRGIYDGDGSLLFDKKRNSMCFQIVGTYQLMQDIQNYLMYYCYLNKTKLTQNILRTNHFALRYRGNIQVVRILTWIYKYANSFSRMDRKFNKFYKTRRIINK